MSKGEIKKLYILYILEILKKYSDADHRLRQQDIIDYMKRDYCISCDRKTVARNITDLLSANVNIEHESDGYYYDDRPFEDSEIKLLMDSVLASGYIPKKQANDLVNKLQEQASIYFKNQNKYIYNLDCYDVSEHNELFWNIEVIGEAIDTNKQIAFFYNKYGSDKKLHETTQTKQIVNPYYITVANGRYYLVGNNNKYDNITHYRMERITKIEILDIMRKPKESIVDFKDGQGLSKHLLEHIYMFSGDSVRVILKIKQNGINDVIDWLGKDIGIRKEEDYYIVDTVTNKAAMKYWAIQFGEIAEVIEPRDLRTEIKKTIEYMYERYKDNNEYD